MDEQHGQNCGKRGHLKSNCPAQKAAQAMTGGDGKNKGDETNGGDGKPRSCPLHMTSNHGEEEFRVRQKHSSNERAIWAQRPGHPVVHDTKQQAPAISLNAAEGLNTETLCCGRSPPQKNQLLLLTAARYLEPSEGSTAKGMEVRPP